MNEVDKQVIGALEEAIPMTSPTTEAVERAIRETMGLMVKHPQAIQNAAEAAISAHLKALEPPLEEVLSDLEGYLKEQHASRDEYPFLMKRYNRDMEPIRKLRTMIAAHKGE